LTFARATGAPAHATAQLTQPQSTFVDRWPEELS
jgi:hypothetical protein